MTISIGSSKLRREEEYSFSRDDRMHYPRLWQLLQQGYNFVVLAKESGDFNQPNLHFSLARQSICSNGSELQERFDALTQSFEQLDQLESHITHNMPGILQKHFFGKHRVRPFTP